MCGLVAVASIQPQAERSWLINSSKTLEHRGPDDSGLWWSSCGKVGLAHRRLSILDLSSAGHQPMHMKDLGLSIAYNGEIYNYSELRDQLSSHGYKFRSNTDTEILLAAYGAWGVNCLARLNGMFAFVLYDSEKDCIFAARDRAGEKPLFFRYDSDTIYIASELKALMSNPKLPRRIDLSALDCYLTMGYIPGGGCILGGFNKLPAAHAMIFDLRKNALNIWRYWQIPSPSTLTPSSPIELLDELELLLEDSVGKQLVADVPVSVLLSGGIDSSLITAMAVRHASKIRTFSIAFPGHGKLDETKHAKLIADYFDTDHEVLVAEPSIAELMPSLARQFDEPLVDSSMIPCWLVSSLVRKYSTVALGGDGGDELFGGYGHYTRLLALQKRSEWLPKILRSTIASIASSILPVGFKGRTWFQAIDCDFKRGLPIAASYFDQTARSKLLPALCTMLGSAEQIFQSRIPSSMDLVDRATRMDFCNYLVEDILVKVDRTSMMNSLEMRSPFLDHRIIEFAFSRVPSSFKASGSARKIILRMLCDRILPSGFDQERKQGFSIPINSWLKKGPFRELFRSVLLDKHCIFNTSFVCQLLDGQDRGLGNGERLFSLVLFELWRREFQVHF